MAFSRFQRQQKRTLVYKLNTLYQNMMHVHTYEEHRKL